MFLNASCQYGTAGRVSPVAYVLIDPLYRNTSAARSTVWSNARSATTSIASGPTASTI
jgi:hypothetical protein